MPSAARGRAAGKSDKPWKDAVRIALADKGPDGKRNLRVIADKLVTLAKEGDMEAIKEIGNRLDGRPAQIVEGNDEAPIKHELVIAWQSSAPKS